MKAKRESFWSFNWRYFWGVGVGLIIAWVTSAIAYLKAGDSILPKLVILEAVLSVVLLITGFVIRSRKK